MFKLFVFVCSVFILTACDKPKPEPQVKTEAKKRLPSEAFHAQASHLLNAINMGQSLASLTSESAALVKVSNALVDQFMQQYPQCTNYLTALNVALAELTSPALEKITRKQLSNLTLPKVNEPICYHAKAVLVHAVTIQVLSIKADKNEQISLVPEHEIISALAHYDQVKKSLNQKQ